MLFFENYAQMAQKYLKMPLCSLKMLMLSVLKMLFFPKIHLKMLFANPGTVSLDARAGHLLWRRPNFNTNAISESALVSYRAGSNQS